MYCECKQILQADDEAFNIMAIENLLECFKMECDSVYNGQGVLDFLNQDAIKKCQNEHQIYKLIILDNQMPDLSGIEVAIKIR